MKKLLYFFLIIFIYIHSNICKVFSKDIELNQDKTTVITSNGIKNNTDNTYDEDLVYEPIKFSPSGLKCFFNHKFNHPKYAQEVLPHNLNDLLNFLEYYKNTNRERKHVKIILKSFHQKIKSLEYVSAKEIIKFINLLPDLLGHYFIPNQNLNDPQKIIYNLIYFEIYNNYQVLKTSPDNFLNNLSDQICRSVLNKTEVSYDYASSTELRWVLIRFLELSLNKLLWNMTKKEDMWSQFKDTCNAIYNLKNSNIIYEIDDINDLINSALARFTFLLDIIGADILPETYEKAKADISNSSLPWLYIEEFDELMQPKKDLLEIALKNGYAKAIASQKYGILTLQ